MEQSGELLGPYEPQETWPAGRVCTYPPCHTELSIYNPNDRCTTHRKSKIFLGSGREPIGYELAPKKRPRTLPGRRSTPPKQGQNVPKNGSGS